jgi:uncharacterized protein with PIN domain
MDDWSKIPGTPEAIVALCPECGEPLTDRREGQYFRPTGVPTMEPSKVCETCRVGYWLGNFGWLAVATVEI